MQEHQHVEGSADYENDREKEVEQLKHWLEDFARKYKFASFRKERTELLMRRRSAKKWTPEKTARMVRRLMTANQEIEQSEGALEQIKHRLEQLGIEVSVESRSAQAESAA